MSSRKVPDALAALQIVFNRFRYMGVPINRVHSDRAEFQSVPIQRWIRQQGLAQSFTPGDDPAANGRVEAEVHQVKRRTCALLHHAGLSNASWPTAIRFAAEQRLRSQLRHLGCIAPPVLPFMQEVAVKRKRWNNAGVLANPFVMGRVLCPSPQMTSGWVVRTTDGNLMHVREAIIPSQVGDQVIVQLQEHPPPPIPVDEHESEGPPRRRLHGKQMADPNQHRVYFPDPVLLLGDSAGDPNVSFGGQSSSSSPNPNPNPASNHASNSENVEGSENTEGPGVSSGVVAEGESRGVSSGAESEGSSGVSSGVLSGVTSGVSSDGGEFLGGRGEVDVVIKSIARRSTYDVEMEWLLDVQDRLSGTLEDRLGGGQEVHVGLEDKILREADFERKVVEDNLQAVEEWREESVRRLCAIQAGNGEGSQGLGECGLEVLGEGNGDPPDVLQTTTVSLDEVRRDLEGRKPAIHKEYESLVNETKAIEPVDVRELDLATTEFVPGKLVCVVKAGEKGSSQDAASGNVYASGADGVLTRTVLCHGVQRGWGMSVVDVKTAFLLAPRKKPEVGAREVIVTPPRS